MTSHSGWSSHNCRVVVGIDAATSVRSEDSQAPVVVLVDERRPEESVRAQAAGADVVLAVSQTGADLDEQPGLEFAVRAAIMNARRRNKTALTSRRAGHDLAEALNVIGLLADAGQHDRLDHAAAFAQIQDLVRGAGDVAWRVGRGHRSSSIVVSCVDLHRVFEQARSFTDVPLTMPQRETFVFADERWLGDALGELVANARRAGATTIDVSSSVSMDRASVEISVVDDGGGFASDGIEVERPFKPGASSDRLGVGLASIAEHASELGGHLQVAHPGGDGRPTCVVLSLPRIDPGLLASRPVEVAANVAPSVGPSAAQANILEGVVQHVPLSESLEGIVSAIENQLPGTMCSILLLHEGLRLRHGAGARLPLDYRAAIDGVEIGLGQGSCGTAAHTGDPVIASDVTIDRNWVDFRSIATEHGLRSCWSTPIVAAEGGETLGTFAVYTSKVWSPDEAAIRLVNRFTYLAAVAIEHHRLFGALAESEARFRGAFEGAAAGIALASLDGVVLKANPALVELVGDSASRLIGTSLLDLVDPDYCDSIIRSWSNVADDGTLLDHVEIPLAHRRSACETWLSLHTSLIPGESGRQPYLYVEVRDVTASRQQRDDMRAREAAEAANQAKTDFLALASHELRTPLNAILGFAQIMQLLELDEGQRGDSIDHIVNAGRHLRDLIDELLDLSRIESGQLSVETTRVDAWMVIDEAVEIVGPLAVARNIELVTHVDLARSPVLFADHRCIRQVLINLLDNAVKYTPTGGRVEVTVDDVVVVDDIKNSTTRIWVTDSGRGISSDSLDAVFQPFHRLDRPADGGSEGTGLGLALCARLMREMDGSIGVTSSVGVGSSFWIEFPSAAAKQAHSDEPASPSADASATTIEPAAGNVLYIEDDPTSVDVMGDALRLRPDVVMTSVQTAAKGAAAIAGGDVDLVLLDVGLPDRSGWDLLAEVQTSHPRLPVIVLTAGPDSVPNGMAPPEHVFTKPIDVAEVLRAIDRSCSRLSNGDLLAEAMDFHDQ